MSFTGATYEFKVFYQRQNLVIAVLYMHHLALYGNALFKKILFSLWKYTECVLTLPVMKAVRQCDIFCSHLTSLLLERQSQSLTFKPVPSAALMRHSLKAILGPSGRVMPNCGIIFKGIKMPFSAYVEDETTQWWQTIWAGLGFAFEVIEVSCVKLKYLTMPDFFFFFWTGLNQKQLNPYLPFMFGIKVNSG